MSISEESGDFDLELPETIKAALRNRYGPVPGVSEEVDRAILEDARQQLAARVQPVRRRGRWGRWQWAALASTMAAASVMFLVAQTRSLPQRQTDSVAFRSPAAPMSAMDNRADRDDMNQHDVDHNGRVDILDAFAVARLIRNGDLRAPDVNRDGHLDQQDVDLVAREAVML